MRREKEKGQHIGGGEKIGRSNVKDIGRNYRKWRKMTNISIGGIGGCKGGNRRKRRDLLA